jgi:hypothetical protein
MWMNAPEVGIVVCHKIAKVDLTRGSTSTMKEREFDAIVSGFAIDFEYKW